MDFLAVRLKNAKTFIAGLYLIKALKDKFEDKRKRKVYLLLLAVIFSIYVFLIILTIHLMLVRMEKPYLDFQNTLVEGFKDIFLHPLQIFPLAPGTGRAVLSVTVLLTLALIVMDLDFRRKAHYDPDTVQGDAQWMKKIGEFSCIYSSPLGETSYDSVHNLIISKDIRLSVTEKIPLNLNVLVIGGSGSGKTFRYVGPNLMNASSSFVCTDPSGQIMRLYAKYLENQGYRIKCLNLNHMEKGNKYNPFRYIHSDKDVVVMVDTLLTNTRSNDNAKGEQIWEDGVRLLLNALVSYLYNYCHESQHNFGNIMRLLQSADVDENDAASQSALDIIFSRLAEYDPESFALANYKLFKKGAGKTLRSFIITAITRLHAFTLINVAELTNSDDIDLDKIGDEKTALFITLPTGEGPFNFLASMLYSQLFQRAYDYAENTAGFSQLVIDSDGQVVKCFRAESEEDSEDKRIEAEEFLERARRGKIRHNKETGLYEFLTDAGELVCFRGSKGDVRRARSSILLGRVISNKEQSTDGLGQRLPIRVMFLMDEFANIGKVPDFEKSATRSPVVKSRWAHSACCCA